MNGFLIPQTQGVPGQLSRPLYFLFLQTSQLVSKILGSEHTLVISGNGDVIEPDDGVIAIGSGGPYAHAAAKALTEFSNLDAKAIAVEAMKIVPPSAFIPMIKSSWKEL